ncbi:calcium-binding protein [Falsiroseomonas sp.]|uniref:calcium-binding protein n=1 Tax=Falsiroseomonas sp. TaxID=2870721 RepID=UPI003F71F4AB
MATLIGGESGDYLDAFSGSEADVLFGMGGEDVLIGGLGADILSGGAGNDLLEGGGGADRLSGGEGADTFRFQRPAEVAGDTIGDFSAADRLLLTFASGWRLLGSAPFSGAGLEIRVTTFTQGSELATRLEIDADGLGGPPVVLTLAGQHDFTLGNGGVLTKVTPLDRLGTSAAEAMNGTAGADTLLGAGGNDTMRGGDGRDSMHGGAGDDVLRGGLGADTLSGGVGADIFIYPLLAEIDGDVIRDFRAEDRLTLSGLAGFTFLADAAFTGTAGEYRYSLANGRGLIELDLDGDALADASMTLLGLTGPLVQRFAGSLTLQIGDRLDRLGTAAAETLQGSQGADSLVGMGGADLLRGGAFQDTLDGGEGADTLDGGSGGDRLLGGTGGDLLLGGEGADSLLGGEGNDTLVGGLGADSLYGGEGANVFVFRSIAELQDDFLAPTTWQDRIDLSALSGFRFLGDLQFDGSPGAIRQTSQGLEFDLDGDGTTDVRLYLNAPLAETAPGSLVLQFVQGQWEYGDDTAETLTGGAGADTVQGNGGDDLLAGGAAADWLRGGDGADTLVGGSGIDVLEGGKGDDVLVGGLGAEGMVGGAGADRFVFNSVEELGWDPVLQRFTGRDWIGDLDFDDIIDLSAIPGLRVVQAFTGRAGEVLITPDALVIDFDGRGLVTPLAQMPGLYTALGGSPTSGDLTEITPGSGLFQRQPVLLTGTEGNDFLGSQGARSIIRGLGGDDALSSIGNYRRDTLEGGSGEDSFVVQWQGSRSTVITDLEVGETVQLVKDPDYYYEAPILAYRGDGAFTGGVPEARLAQNVWVDDVFLQTALLVNSGGDTAPEMALDLNGFAGTLVLQGSGPFATTLLAVDQVL